MRRKFQHFLLFLLLINCSWAYGINSQVDLKHSSGNAVGAASLTIAQITTGPCTLHVYWTCASCDTATFDGYNVTWQEAGKDKETAPTLISRKSSNYPIEGLNSDASYTVSVVAVVDGEETTISDSEQKSTEKGEPVKVTGVTIGEVSDSVINVSWNETSNECPIQGYRVTWDGTSEYNGEEIKGYRDTDKTTMEVDNLTPYADYEISVSEITTDGTVGDPSDPATAETKEGAASPPEPVISLALGPYSAQVNWTFPDTPNGVITGYHISCQILPDLTDDCDIIINGPDILTTDATGLQACGDYTFSVQAITLYGLGEPGTDSSRTESEPPPNFTTFGHENTTSTSVVLTWEPLDTHCPVTNYNIHVEETVLWSDATDAYYTSYTGEDNFFLLDGLTPYSSYDISMRATTAGGTTTVANAATQSFDTLQGVPDAPAFLNSSTVDESTVSLYWLPPENIYGVFKEYVICHRKGTDLVNYCRLTTDKDSVYFDVSGLDACGDYTFSVQANNGGEEEGQKAYTRSSTEDEAPTNIEKVDAATDSPPTSTSITLTITFEEPATTCEILHYNIVGEGLTKWNNGSVDFKNTFVPESDGTVVVNNLIPFTSYTFNVSATTAGGTSNGVIFEGDTDKDVPSQPTSLEATAEDTTSIKVTWEEPEYQNGRTLGSYYLTWGLLGSESDAIEVKTLRQYTIGDKSHDNEELLPCQTYTIRVRASNEMGNGTAAKNLAGLDSEVPDAVTRLRCKTIEANQIEIAWKVQQTACRITHYEIFADGDIIWGGVTNKTLDVSNIPSIRGSLILDDLIAYTSYNITLTPGNDAGLGEPTSYTCETEETVPGPPINLKVTDKSKSKLEVHWDAPEMRNGFLTRFRITWNGNAGKYIDAHNETNSYSYTIEDLDDETSYAIFVYAENAEGFGPASEQFPGYTDKSHLGAILGTVIPVIVIIIAVIAGVWYNQNSKKKKKNKANIDD